MSFKLLSVERVPENRPPLLAKFKSAGRTHECFLDGYHLTNPGAFQRAVANHAGIWVEPDVPRGEWGRTVAAAFEAGQAVPN